MASFSFSREGFASVLHTLGGKYALWGPKRLKGKGRFFGTDLVTCAPLESFDDLETGEKTSMSPKEIVFPPDETLFYFTGDRFSEPPLEDDRETVVFLRPCDISGFRRLPCSSKGGADPYYRRRREKLHFFMIECRGLRELLRLHRSNAGQLCRRLSVQEDSEGEVGPAVHAVFSSGTPSSFAKFVKRMSK